MDELDSIDTYIGNPEYDSWVDFDYHDNTGEQSELFDDSNMEKYIIKLND